MVAGAKDEHVRLQRVFKVGHGILSDAEYVMASLAFIASRESRVCLSTCDTMVSSRKRRRISSDSGVQSHIEQQSDANPLSGKEMDIWEAFREEYIECKAPPKSCIFMAYLLTLRHQLLSNFLYRFTGTLRSSMKLMLKLMVNGGLFLFSLPWSSKLSLLL